MLHADLVCAKAGKPAAEIVIPAGEEWTLPKNTMLNGVSLTIRVEGTLRVRGWMECGMTSTENDGVIVVEKDGGFIGGASGLCGNRLFFSGDPLTHPDGEAIYDFCRKHGTKPVPLTSGKLFDGGGIIFP